MTIIIIVTTEDIIKWMKDEAALFTASKSSSLSGQIGLHILTLLA